MRHTPLVLRILFVDDESLLRNVLKRLLRAQDAGWEVVAAGSGEEALEQLRAGRFDVVVSDMVMPGMDGATLLRHVRDESPQTVRLVLSGYADEQAVMGCVRVAHQFLAKPLDARSLAKVIKRATAFRDEVTDEGQRTMITGLDRIPSPPASYWQITQALSDPLAGLDRVARLVEGDPAVSVKLLQLVNSAYFGVSRQVSSVRMAVTLLGTELLRSLVFACHVIAALEKMSWATPSIKEGFDRVLQCGQLTGKLAQRIRGDGLAGQEAFAGGLFHDLGKLVAGAARPQIFEQILLGPPGPQVLEQERDRYGFAHPAAGAYLLGLWGIPNGIVDAVAHHHAPAEVEPDALGPVGAVHVAASLSEEVLGAKNTAVETVLDSAWLRRLGLEQQLPAWRLWAIDELKALGRP